MGSKPGPFTNAEVLRRIYRVFPSEDTDTAELMQHIAKTLGFHDGFFNYEDTKKKEKERHAAAKADALHRTQFADFTSADTRFPECIPVPVKASLEESMDRLHQEFYNLRRAHTVTRSCLDVLTVRVEAMERKEKKKRKK